MEDTPLQKKGEAKDEKETVIMSQSHQESFIIIKKRHPVFVHFRHIWCVIGDVACLPVTMSEPRTLFPSSISSG